MDSSPISEGITSGRIEATDDVEGHTAKVHAVDGADANDVEGHGTMRGGLLPEETDEVEGHGARFTGLVKDDEDDYTEGHGVRVRF